MTEALQKYARISGLDVNETEDGLIVFNPATDSVHHLNYTAGVLFELCQGTHSAAELATLMADFYTLDAAPAEETETGLQQLVSEGLLTKVDGE